MGDLIITFLIAVGANVISAYICKWLDSDKQTATA